MKTTKAKHKPKGKRYTEAEKKKILNHVAQVNKTRGRGGISSASKKFGVTALTISNWMKVSAPSAISMRSASTNATAAATLRRLADIHDEIIKRERELVPLRREYQKLKARL